LKSLQEDEWKVQRCELQIVNTTELEPEKFANKRLVVFDKDRHGDLDKLLSNSQAAQL